LEERANYRKESANGLYSALPFVIANSIVTIPFLFVCCVLFVLIAYWGIVSLSPLTIEHLSGLTIEILGE
jgi:ABC-type multidrug transport system permease subunit